MQNLYYVLNVYCPKELDYEVDEFVAVTENEGVEIFDSEMVQEFERQSSEWELADDRELLAQMEKSCGMKLNDKVVRHVYFEYSAEGKNRAQQLFDILTKIPNVHYDPYRIVDISGWDEEWKKFYSPIVIDNQLQILPAWEKSENTGIPTIYIEPGMAFGTGSHETTALTLSLMISETFNGKRVLDIGCGSGILSIYVKKRGASLVHALDIDEDALKNCETNCKLNRISDIEILKSDLLQKATGKYDVICANLLLPLLRRMFLQLKEHIHSSTVLFLSGILENQLKETKELAIKAGFRISDIKKENEWVALCLICDRKEV